MLDLSLQVDFNITMKLKSAQTAHITHATFFIWLVLPTSPRRPRSVLQYFKWHFRLVIGSRQFYLQYLLVCFCNCLRALFIHPESGFQMPKNWDRVWSWSHFRQSQLGSGPSATPLRWVDWPHLGRRVKRVFYYGVPDSIRDKHSAFPIGMDWHGLFVHRQAPSKKCQLRWM